MAKPIHCLIGAAEGRDFLMHAPIWMPRALNADKPREFTENKATTGASAS